MNIIEIFIIAVLSTNSPSEYQLTQEEQVIHTEMALKNSSRYISEQEKMLD